MSFYTTSFHLDTRHVQVFQPQPFPSNGNNQVMAEYEPYDDSILDSTIDRISPISTPDTCAYDDDDDFNSIRELAELTDDEWVFEEPLADESAETVEVVDLTNDSGRSTPIGGSPDRYHPARRVVDLSRSSSPLERVLLPTLSYERLHNPNPNSPAFTMMS